jgi:uncharacterized protein
VDRTVALFTRRIPENRANTGKEVRFFVYDLPEAVMLAKLTSKNQITLLKAIVSNVDAAKYFEVTVEDRRIVLTVRDKLQRTEQDLEEAIAWVRRDWQHRQLQPLVCKEMAHKLLRVLAYPKLKLTAQDHQDLLGDFLHYAEAPQLPKPWPVLPICRDETDQMFLVLELVGQAEALITGNSDLLAMRDDFPSLIVTPDEWAGQRGGPRYASLRLLG